MRDLQEGYLRDLPTKLAEIRGLVLHLRATPADEAAVHDLAHAVQRLVGSAGSYGFLGISETLSAPARLLAHAEDGLVALSERDLGHLLELLDGVAGSRTGAEPDRTQLT